MPFKALDSLIDAALRLPAALAAGGSRQHDAARHPSVAAGVPGPAPGRSRLRCPAAQPGRGGPARIAPPRLRALRELLARIGDRRPLVLFVDDLQWGDVDSALMLCDLLRPPDPPLLWFIGAYRAEDAETGAFLRAFRETEQRALQRLNQRELAVGPLEETAARRLAELLVGRDAVDSSDDAETVARESGGSPFFARELARYLQSAPSQTARHIDLEAMLVARLEGLPPPAQRLMETLAVAGRPTSQHEILAASGVVDDVPLFLARLKAEHLIRVSGTELEPLLETYHDRIREATLAQIAPPRLPDVHGRLADAIFSSLQVSFDDLARWARIGSTLDGSSPGLDLSSRDWQRVFDLAHHYGAAGQHGQALVFALLAAEQARRQHSLDIAERQYRIASAACAEADPPTRYRIARGLGEVWMRRGNYRGARHMLEAARHLAQGEPPLVTAEIEGRWANWRSNAAT